MKDCQGNRIRTLVRAFIYELHESRTFPQWRGTPLRKKEQWKRKHSILRAMGFKLTRRHDLYVNPEMKKVLSWEYVQRKSLETICEKVLENNPTKDIKFYFLKTPSKGILDYFSEMIKKSTGKKRLVNL